MTHLNAVQPQQIKVQQQQSKMSKAIEIQNLVESKLIALDNHRLMVASRSLRGISCQHLRDGMLLLACLLVQYRI
jgi:hypothetical protein